MTAKSAISAADAAVALSRQPDAHGSIDPLTDVERNPVLNHWILAMRGFGLRLLAHRRRGFWANKPSGLMVWARESKATLQSLCEASFDGETLDLNARINPTLASRGPIYRDRPDVLCSVHHRGSMHHRGDNCVAAGAIGATLLPINNHAARWHGDVRLVKEYEDTLSIAEQGEIMAREFATAKGPAAQAPRAYRRAWLDFEGLWFVRRSSKARWACS